MTVEKLITDHIDIWSSALQTRSTAGRGSNGKIDLYGIKKLRELILELAVRGKLVPQDTNNEPASELLKRIAAEKAELVKQGKIKKQKPLPEISEEEMPFELPKGWEWVRLGDIGETNIGLTYSPANVSSEGIPVLRSSNIQQGQIDLSDLVRVNVKDVKESSLVNVDDLLICARNGSKALVGKAAMIISLHEPMAFGAFMAIYRSPFNLYIKQFMNSPLFRCGLEGTDTTTINQITQANLKNTVCPFPPFNEQTKITTKLSTLLGLCDQLEQQSLTSLDAHYQLVETMLATLTDSQNAEELAENWTRISHHFDTLFTTEASIDALKQTILQLAVMGKLVPQDPSDEPASELLKRIEQEKAQLVKEGKIKKQKSLPPVNDEEKPFELPQGWVFARLGVICKKITDGTHHSPINSEQGDFLYITAKNIKNNGVQLSNATYIPKAVHDEIYSRCNPEEGDILYIKDGATTGIATINNMVEPFSMLSSVALLKLPEHILNLYILHSLRAPYFYKLIRNDMSGVAITRVTLKKLENAFISLPPDEEQKRISMRINELFSICDTLKSRLQSAQQTQLHLADALTDAALN